MIYALGDISGAHFNPAVTLAIFLSKQAPLTGKDVGLYMLAQLAGGVVAAYSYMMLFLGHSFPLGPMPAYGWGDVFVAEVIFTFLLCYVVLCVAVSTETKSASMFGLAIGSCVTVGGFA